MEAFYCVFSYKFVEVLKKKASLTLKTGYEKLTARKYMNVRSYFSKSLENSFSNNAKMPIFHTYPSLLD